MMLSLRRSLSGLAFGWVMAASPLAALRLATLKPDRRRPLALGRSAPVAVLLRELQERLGREPAGPEGSPFPTDHRQARDLEFPCQFLLAEAQALAQGLDPFPVNQTTFAARFHGGESNK